VTIGANADGNLNILIFEVGMIKTVELPGVGTVQELVKTFSIHPLLVSQTTWGYQDRSRSASTETIGGSLVTKAG